MMNRTESSVSCKTSDIAHEESPPSESPVHGSAVSIQTTLGWLYRCRYGIAWCSLSTVGSLGIEYCRAICAGLVINVSFIDHMGEMHLGAGDSRALDPKRVRMWAGAYAAGYLASSMVAWWPLDRFGRRAGIWLAQVLVATSVITASLAGHWVVWMICQLLLGPSAGLSQCATLAYVSETAPARLRGFALGSFHIALVLGRIIACGAEYLSLVTTPTSFRILLYSQIAFIICTLIIAAWLPESPRWLAFKRRIEAAKVSLHRSHGAESADDVSDALRDVLDEVESPHQLPLWRGLICNGQMRRMLVCGLPMLWSVWFGEPILRFYDTYFFELAGVIDLATSTTTTLSVSLAGAVLAVCLVDKLGRRTFIIYPAIAMPFAIFAIGGIVHHPLRDWTGIVLAVTSSLWFLANGASIAPLSYVYLGEISNHQLRALCISLVTVCAGLCNALGQFCTPFMLVNRSLGLYTASLFYGCIGLIGVILFFVLMPETNRMSNRQLDDLFVRAKNPMEPLSNTAAA